MSKLPVITIIDYDAGNIRSIVNMLRALGLNGKVASDAASIARAERLILPGVGHFDHGIQGLHKRGLVEALNDRVLGDKIPILGICLGAQLFTRASEEGSEPGLGWIAADTRRFVASRMPAHLRIPHMGWADTWVDTRAGHASPLSAALTADSRFYYVHSYHIVCDRPETSVLVAQHGYPFTAGVQKDNVLGVQFHPEKSHRFGMQLLKSFAAWNPAREAAA